MGLLAVAACTQETPQQRAQKPSYSALPAGGGDLRPKRLIFGLTPYLPSDMMKREFAPLVTYLSAGIELPTEVVVAADYTDLARRLAANEVHVAVFSPFSYVRAKQQMPEILLLCTHIAHGSSTYSAYLITHQESGITSVEDLRGKRFGFVDKGSASGYLYPLAYLRNLGMEPSSFFSQVEFVGNHPTLIEKLIHRELDAGATFSTAYRNSESKSLRILAKTGRIPYDAYTASPRLERKLITQLRDLLLGLSTRNEEGRRVLSSMTNINGFVAVDDDHYDEVRRVARLVEGEGPTSP